MQIQNTELNLIDGTALAEVYHYESTDIENLQKLYNSWIDLSQLSIQMGGRKINITEVLSEMAFCIAMGDNYVRVKNCYGNVNSSFDCIKITNSNELDIRIQVKAASITPDLTSFGPKSEWDEIYFCDFSRLDGTFDIYHIPNELVYNNPVNSYETMQEMQQSGKRPRMSIYNLAQEKNIQPLKTFDLLNK